MANISHLKRERPNELLVLNEGEDPLPFHLLFEIPTLAELFRAGAWPEIHSLEAVMQFSNLLFAVKIDFLYTKRKTISLDNDSHLVCSKR